MTIEYFQPILETLADLDRHDPKLAFQAARAVGLYRRVWASCEPSGHGGEKVDQKRGILGEAPIKLGNEQDGLQLRPNEQLCFLDSFERALEQTQERLVSVLKEWNQVLRSDLAVMIDTDRYA